MSIGMLCFVVDVIYIFFLVQLKKGNSNYIS